MAIHARVNGHWVALAAGVMDDLLLACRDILTEHLSKISNAARILTFQNGRA